MNSRSAYEACARALPSTGARRNRGTYRAVGRRLAPLLFPLFGLISNAAADTLSEALEALAKAHDFPVRGIELLRDEPAPESFGNLREQLSSLLQAYDHVILGAPPSVERIIVLGPKADTPALVRIKTKRRNTHHFVDVIVIGPSSRRFQIALMIDSGASTLVLPASLIEPLGFDPEQLLTKRAQTVNGPVEGLSALLDSVQLRGAVQEAVEVVFIPDEKLGQARLLGMSFLRNYQFTLDDRANELRLQKR